MNSAGRFLKELERERARRDGSQGPLTVQVSHGGAKVQMDIEDADRLGVLTGQTRVSRRAGPPDPDALASQANGIVARVTYLEESLALIELDRRRCRAVVRSASPRAGEGAIHYYEAVLEGGRQVTVRRYRYDKAARRRQSEPANLSVETASRLAGDLLDLFSAR